MLLLLIIIINHCLLLLLIIIIIDINTWIDINMDHIVMINISHLLSSINSDYIMVIFIDLMGMNGDGNRSPVITNDDGNQW